MTDNVVNSDAATAQFTFMRRELERDAVHVWLALHDIDHTRVPIQARIEQDPETGDWLVEAFGDERAEMVTLRRPFKAKLPWPTRGMRPADAQG